MDLTQFFLIFSKKKVSLKIIVKHQILNSKFSQSRFHNIISWMLQKFSFKTFKDDNYFRSYQLLFTFAINNIFSRN